MADVVLVRHAATAWSGVRYCGRTDLPLTASGAAAAEALGLALASSLPSSTQVVSSPLLRALETARAIATAIGAAGFTLDERWSETDFGAVEGLTFAELQAAHPRIAEQVAGGDTGIDWPEGETAAALRDRVEEAWRDLAAATGHWVVVSHGGPLRIAIALASGADASDVVVPEPGGRWRQG
jgi:broad specificity phosphatase PhoE